MRASSCKGKAVLACVSQQVREQIDMWYEGDLRARSCMVQDVHVAWRQPPQGPLHSFKPTSNCTERPGRQLMQLHAAPSHKTASPRVVVASFKAVHTVWRQASSLRVCSSGESQLCGVCAHVISCTLPVSTHGVLVPEARTKESGMLGPSTWTLHCVRTRLPYALQ